MKLRNIGKTLFVTVAMALTASSASAQDMMARQAPVDHKAKAVDPIVFKTIVEKENTENPSSDLYEEWENKRTHAVYALPDRYQIDLRGFRMPTNSRVITSNFGRRWGRMHKGLDIKVYIGDTIRAAFSGRVRIVRYEARGYGKYVVIRHNNGLETVYGHLSAQLVYENQYVRAGQPIGLGGNTGRSTGSHLHFETRLCGTALNPALMFDFRNQDVTGDFYTYRRSTVDHESLQATRLRGKNDDHGYTREDVQGPATQRQSYRSLPATGTSESASLNVNTNGRQQSDNIISVAGTEIRWYKVTDGDTLESVSEKTGTSIETLCRLNHIGRFTRLTKDQLLKCS